MSESGVPEASRAADTVPNTTTSEGTVATGDVGRIIKSADERKAILDRTLQLWGAKGWRIENRSDFQATVAKGKEISHVLHFFLALFTLGIWLVFCRTTTLTTSATARRRSGTTPGCPLGSLRTVAGGRRRPYHWRSTRT